MRAARLYSYNLAIPCLYSSNPYVVSYAQGFCMANRGRTTNIAAIDAGSNAIRLVIAEAKSLHTYHELKNERVALRLGHHAFTQRRFDGQTIDQAVEVFQRFKS